MFLLFYKVLNFFADIIFSLIHVTFKESNLVTLCSLLQNIFSQSPPVYTRPSSQPSPPTPPPPPQLLQPPVNGGQSSLSSPVLRAYSSQSPTPPPLPPPPPYQSSP